MLTQWKHTPLFRSIALTVIMTFVAMIPAQSSYAQVVMQMPSPGVMIHQTGRFEPALMAGMRVDLKDPFSFYFIMDRGEKDMVDDVKKNEYSKLIKYFLSSLTIANDDMWVNLSPIEAERIIPDNFGQTEMGRDLLAQDYVLKQFTSSLMYPEDAVGKEFWKKVYSETYAKYGTTDVPIDTFNKVWIIADKASIYQKDDTAFLVDSHLKVMLEEDFKLIEQNKAQFANTGEPEDEATAASRQIASNMVREIIVPLIEKEVNEGESFAQVRQAYSAMIMATWFKKTLKQSLLGQAYADKNRLAGVENNDPNAKEKIYRQYLEAYKIGVFNYIKEEIDPLTDELLPRKYFSGGIVSISDSSMEVASEPEAGVKVEERQQYLEAARALLVGVGPTPLSFPNPSMASADEERAFLAMSIKDVFETLESSAFNMEEIDAQMTQLRGQVQVLQETLLNKTDVSIQEGSEALDVVRLKYVQMAKYQEMFIHKMAELKELLDGLQQIQKSHDFTNGSAQEEFDALFKSVPIAQAWLSEEDIRVKNNSAHLREIEQQIEEAESSLKAIQQQQSKGEKPSEGQIRSYRSKLITVLKALGSLVLWVLKGRKDKKTKEIEMTVDKTGEVAGAEAIKEVAAAAKAAAEAVFLNVEEEPVHVEPAPVYKNEGNVTPPSEETTQEETESLTGVRQRLLQVLKARENQLERAPSSDKEKPAKQVESDQSKISRLLENESDPEIKEKLEKTLKNSRDAFLNYQAGKVLLVEADARDPKTVSDIEKQAVEELRAEIELVEARIKLMKEEPVGGIDLGEENLTISIKVDGAGMPLPFEMQDPAMINLQGLSPIIREIAPVGPMNVPVLFRLMEMAGSTV